jgi:hypothetical protein
MKMNAQTNRIVETKYNRAMQLAHPSKHPAEMYEKYTKITLQVIEAYMRGFECELDWIIADLEAEQMKTTS